MSVYKFCLQPNRIDRVAKTNGVTFEVEDTKYYDNSYSLPKRLNGYLIK